LEDQCRTPSAGDDRGVSKSVLQQTYSRTSTRNFRCCHSVGGTAELFLTSSSLDIGELGDADRRQLDFSPATIKVPGVAVRKPYKSEDLYGERSAGKAALAAGSGEIVVGSRRSQGGHGPKDGAEVPAGSAAAERHEEQTQLANSPRSIRCRLG